MQAPPYDYDNLMFNSKGRPCYVVDGQILSSMGIDVSDHEGDIDWDAVAADGVDFCHIGGCFGNIKCSSLGK